MSGSTALGEKMTIFFYKINDEYECFSNRNSPLRKDWKEADTYKMEAEYLRNNRR